MPVGVFEYLLAYVIHHCRILSDLLIVYQICIRTWTLSPQPTHHIQPLCAARPCAFCAKIYPGVSSLSFLSFTQPPQITRSIPGATSVPSPNLIAPAYVVPHLQAPVPHSLSLRSQVLHILYQGQACWLQQILPSINCPQLPDPLQNSLLGSQCLAYMPIQFPVSTWISST